MRSTPTGWNYEGYASLSHHAESLASHMTPTPANPTMLEGFDPEAGRMVYTVNIFGEHQDASLDPEGQLRLMHERFEEMTQRAHRIRIHNWHGQPARDQPEVDQVKLQLADDLQRIRTLTREVLAADPVAHFTEGRVLTALERHAEAEAALRKAVALAPDWPDAAGELIASLAHQGKINEAIEVGKRAHALHPDHHIVGINLAINLHSRGRHDEAVAVLDRVLEAGSTNPAVENLKRRIQADSKRRT